MSKVIRKIPTFSEVREDNVWIIIIPHLAFLAVPSFIPQRAISPT